MDRWLTNDQELIDGWTPIPLCTESLIDTSFDSCLCLPNSRQDYSAVNIFDFFFSDEVLQEIVNRTNSAQATSVALDKAKGHHLKWKELTINELKVYMGMLIMMGINKLPTLKMHWQNHGMWDNILLRLSMTASRFQQISRYLALGEKNPEDPLARVRSLSNAIQAKSIELYSPANNIAIDESMIAFKGRHNLRQYMPLKPTRYGFKAFLLCESDTGYCYKHIFFSGRKQEQFKPQNICLDLVSGLENKGYHLYIDNYYTSVSLLTHLSQRHIYCTGTVRQFSKGLPNINEYLKNKTINQQVFLKKEEIVLCLYEDKKLVKMISNFYTSEMTTKTNRKKEERVDPYPLVIANYQKNMGGVDLFDQMLTYYHYPHRFIKWWKYLFIYLMEVALYNSFIIYTKLQGQRGEIKIKYLDFRLELILKLTRFDERPRLEEEIIGLKGRSLSHYPMRTGISKRCVYCTSVGIDSKSTYQCNKCNVQLHTKGKKDCFDRYHSLIL